MNKLNRILPAELNHDTVTAVSYKGETWYIAKEVCDALDISDHLGAMDTLPWEDRAFVDIPALHPNEPHFIVNEAGLYSLTLQGWTPPAADFQEWLTKEVLPSIRRIGSYAPQSRRPNPYDPSELRRMLLDFEASEREHNRH